MLPSVSPFLFPFAAPSPPPRLSLCNKRNRWGYYMMAAIAAQIGSGWLRVKALMGEYSNFALLHRVRLVNYSIVCG